MKKTYFAILALTAILLFVATIPRFTLGGPSEIDSEELLVYMFGDTDVLQVPDGETTVEYISREIEAPFMIYAISANWKASLPDKTYAEISVRAKEEDTWSPWAIIGVDDDNIEYNVGDEEDYIMYLGQLTPVKGEIFQYKIELGTFSSLSPALDEVSFEYFGGNPEVMGNIPTADAASTYFTRSSWGANESLRVWSDDNKDPQTVPIDEDWAEEYAHEMVIVREISKNDKGEDLTWPLQYTDTIRKITIHHTARVAPTNEYDALQYMRALYRFHTLSRGWGDIGYNYIIDPFGNIYEGRYGGDKVTGAHVAKHNIGNIGISLMGDYSSCEEKFAKDSTEYQACKLGDPDFSDYKITPATQEALIELLVQKTEAHNLNPVGTTQFRGSKTPSIVGHRDLGNTRCPGGNLYAELKDIRYEVAIRQGETIDFLLGDNSNIPTAPSGTSGSTRIDPIAYDGNFLTNNPRNINMASGARSNIILRIENTGNTIWDDESYLKLAQPVDGFTLFNKDDQADKLYQLDPLIGTEEIASFPVTIEAAPLTEGTFTLDFVPVFNGFYEIKDKIWSITVTVSANGTTTVGSQVFNNELSLETQKVVFTDVNGSTPHYTAIQYLKDNGIVSGFPDGSFKPNQTVTRAEALKIALNGAHVATDSFLERGIEFKDVTSEHTLVQFINYAKYNGIVSGYPDGTFKPNSTISRGEASKVLLKIKGVALTEPDTDPYSDVPKSLDLAKYIAYIKSHNLTSLTGPEFYINGYMTRGDIAEMMYRVMTDKTVVAASNTSFGGPTVVVQDNTSTGDTIRIALAYVDSSMTLSTKEAYTVSGNGSSFSVAGGQPVTFSLSNNTIFANSTNLGQTARLEGGDIVTIESWNNPVSWNPSLNDNTFRGTIELRIKNNQLYVINELPLENYLKGLAEVSNSAPYEKQKAMAVIARTYAYYYMTRDTKYPGEPYTLNSDPDSSQKYLGYGYELRSPMFTKAVNETTGTMVTYEDNVVKTPYFSSSDGTTKSAYEVWGWTHTPYLQSVPDPLCEGNAQEGHGVGLSGCGAEAAAKNGKSYQEILQYYYQGIELKKLY